MAALCLNDTFSMQCPIPEWDVFRFYEMVGWTENNRLPVANLSYRLLKKLARSYDVSGNDFKIVS
jgi:hypothetical protein